MMNEEDDEEATGSSQYRHCSPTPSQETEEAHHQPDNPEVYSPHHQHAPCASLLTMETRTESRMVTSCRIILLVFLLTCTILVALGVFYYTSQQEQEDLESTFHESAIKVIGAVSSTLYTSLEALDAFAVDTAILASTLETNNNATRYTVAPWPFVTTPHFATRAAKLKSLSKAFIIIQYNYVPANLRQVWEEYSLQHDGWVSQGMEVQDNDPNFDGLRLDSWSPQPLLYNNWEGNFTSPGPYMVSWQNYPIVPVYPPYNWDAMSFLPFQHAWPQVQQGNVVLRCSNMPDPKDTQAVTEAGYTNDWASSYLPPDAHPAEPQIEVSTASCRQFGGMVSRLLDCDTITHESKL